MIYKPEAIPYVLNINLILCHFMAKGQHKYFYYAMVVDFKILCVTIYPIFCNREVRYFLWMCNTYDSSAYDYDNVIIIWF